MVVIIANTFLVLFGLLCSYLIVESDAAKTYKVIATLLIAFILFSFFFGPK